MTKFRTYYGFPIRWPFEDGIPIENEFLFGLYEYHFTTYQHMLEVTGTNNPRDGLIDYMVKAYPLFPNHIDPRVTSKELSHDQLTAYLSFAFYHYQNELALEKLNSRVFFSKYEDLASGIGVYRPNHPRDFIYCRLLNKKSSGFLLLPLFYLICAFSMLISHRLVKRDGKLKIEPKLSGELLWCLRVLTVEHDKLLRACFYPCKLLIKLGAYLRFGGVKNMIKRYFQDNEEHPIIKNMKETIL